MKYLSKVKQLLANTLFLGFNAFFGLLFNSQDLVAQTIFFSEQSLKQIKDDALEEPKNILKKQFSYGQALELGKLPDTIIWTITGSNGTVSGKGNTLNDYVFNEAGDYEISIQENAIKSAQPFEAQAEEDCTEPKWPSVIQLRVNAIKMTFYHAKLQLSADIRKGEDTRGITMSVPVTIETLVEQKLDYTYTTVNTAGIGTNIVAKLKVGTILKVGKQTLEYELSGVAEEEAYIMFDFTDINGKVQAAALKNLIK
jgi:hypothetical protein